MLGYLLVFVGGGLGSICRYGIAQLLSAYQLTFPLATLLANILSCFILGLMMGLSMKNAVGPEARVMIMAGFCGGFSTFSTFSSETFQLLQSGNYTYAFTNVLGSLLICLLFIFLGIKAAG